MSNTFSKITQEQSPTKVHGTFNKTTIVDGQTEVGESTGIEDLKNKRKQMSMIFSQNNHSLILEEGREAVL